jgi:hypothetical protein
MLESEFLSVGQEEILVNMIDSFESNIFPRQLFYDGMKLTQEIPPMMRMMMMMMITLFLTVVVVR